MDRRERWAHPGGGQSPPGWRAPSPGAPESERPASRGREAAGDHPSVGLAHGPSHTRPARLHRTARWASGWAPTPPADATGCPLAGSARTTGEPHVRLAPGARRAARLPGPCSPAADGWRPGDHPSPSGAARPRTVCAGPRRRARATGWPASGPPGGPRARPGPWRAGRAAASGAGRAVAGGAGARALWRAPHPAGVRHRGCSPSRRRRPAGRRGLAGRSGCRQSQRRCSLAPRGRPSGAPAPPGRAPARAWSATRRPSGRAPWCGVREQPPSPRAERGERAGANGWGRCWGAHPPRRVRGPPPGTGRPGPASPHPDGRPRPRGALAWAARWRPAPGCRGPASAPPRR